MARLLRIGVVLALSLALALGLLTLPFGPWLANTQALNSIRYVSPSGVDGSNNCLLPASPCTTIQHAVDVANPGDEVRVAAGTYTGLTVRQGLTQVLYIDKSITVRGGYAPYDWTLSDALNRPTIVDAQRQGQAVYVTGPNTVILEGLHITGGYVPGYQDINGSGLLVFTATVVLDNNVIYSNVVSRGGALLFVSSDNVTLTYNTIRDNTGSGMGFLYQKQATLIGNTVRDNTSTGVFLLAYGANLLDNTISGNGPNACEGGGILLYGGDEFLLTGNRISSNFCIDVRGGAGGGIWFYGASAVLRDNIISYNRMNGVGGGLALYHGSSVSSTNNLIIGNEATKGGGLFLAEINRATLTNTIIAANQVITVGSGLYLEGSSARLVHSTIAGNHGGDGSGVHLSTYPYSSSVALTNTILAGHQKGISAGWGSTADLEATLWGSGAWANAIDWTGPGSISTGTLNIWADPGFIAPDEGNYHLQMGSAALDQGIAAGVFEDIDGELRPYGAGYDLGADEGQPSLEVKLTAVPDPAWPGAPLTYTVLVTNTGYVTLTAQVTATLPEWVTPDTDRVWHTLVPLGKVWREEVAVSVLPDYSGPLTTTLRVTTAEGPNGTYTHTLVVDRLIYLPVIWRAR